MLVVSGERSYLVTRRSLYHEWHNVFFIRELRTASVVVETLGELAVRAEDIDRAAEALRFANAARIHTFIATSPIHMKYKLRLEPDAVVGEQVESPMKQTRDQAAPAIVDTQDAR